MTHFALALSNYISGKLGKRTAFVELAASSQILALSSGRNREKSFVYHDISFFPCTNLTSLREILELDFDYFVLDFGVLNSYSFGEFLRYENRFLVCSLSKWKRERSLETLKKFASTNKNILECFKILSLSIDKKSTLQLSRHIKLYLCPLPFLPNPFLLPANLFTFFNRTLKEII